MEAKDKKKVDPELIKKLHQAKLKKINQNETVNK